MSAATPRAAGRPSREELLARVDLPALADQMLPGGRGTGRGRRWACPAPQHGPQTGKTPPVSLYSRGREQRWKCHGCGAGGTAVDLVMHTRGVDLRGAFDHLRDLAGGDAAPTPRPAAPAPPPPSEPDPAVDAYVHRAEQLLWTRLGAAGRDYLHARGLTDELARVNRIGFDPGPRLLARPRGLPRGGPAIVLPAVDDHGRLRYFQARYLHPDPDGGRGKYDSAVSDLIGPSPRVVFPRGPAPAADPRTVLICEGQLDGLSAAQAGYATAAVLGSGYPDDRVARTLLDRYPGDQRLVIVFDDHPSGHAGAARLADLLREHGANGRVAQVTPLHGDDVNHWLQTAGPDFGDQLRDRVSAADTRPAWSARVLHAGRDGRLVHVHTFWLTQPLIDSETSHAADPTRRANPALLAADVAADLSATPAEQFHGVYHHLATDYARQRLRPFAAGDAVLVTAPDGNASTQVRLGADGWQDLQRPGPAPPTPATAAPAAPAPTPQVTGVAAAPSVPAPPLVAGLW